MAEYLLFAIDNQECAVLLESVKRVIWSVAVTSINSLSTNLLGMVNIQGKILPVLNTRSALGLRNKEIMLSDQFIICGFPSVEAILWVDRVLEIGRFEAERLSCGVELPTACRGVSSVLKRENKLIFVYDWEMLINQGVLVQNGGQKCEK